MISKSNLVAKPIKGLATIYVVDLVSDNNDKRYEPAGRMAAVIMEVIQENGDCTPQDLNATDFSPEEISKYWHLAKSLAAVEMRLMGLAPKQPKSMFRGR